MLDAKGFDIVSAMNIGNRNFFITVEISTIQKKDCTFSKRATTKVMFKEKKTKKQSKR